MGGASFFALGGSVGARKRAQGRQYLSKNTKHCKHKNESHNSTTTEYSIKADYQRELTKNTQSKVFSATEINCQ